MTDARNRALRSIGGLAVRRPSRLDDPVVELLRDQNLVVVNTFGADDTIHSRPMWVDTDGQHVVLNSVPGRQWVRDLERDARVTCTVVNRTNPYEFVSMEGRLVEITTEGADAHIDFLARKYLGLERYPFAGAGEQRVLVRVHCDRILHMAPEEPALG